MRVREEAEMLTYDLNHRGSRRYMNIFTSVSGRISRQAF